MSLIVKWFLIAFAVLLVGVCAFLSYMAGSPKDVYYMVQFREDKSLT